MKGKPCNYLIIFGLLMLWSNMALSLSDDNKDRSGGVINQKEETVLEQKLDEQYQRDNYPSIINLYRPNYGLPYYYTNRPYQAIYNNETPNNQAVMNDELKAQISLLVPVIQHVIKSEPLALNFAYTQLMYWQVYAKSQYFRETNYEPELFLENYFSPSLAGQIGVNHQSNGRGGILERSWNRAIGQLQFSGDDWLINLKGWALIDKDDSSDLHNPDIAHYLGYDNFLLAYKFRELEANLEVQNLESGLKRGYVQFTLSYPLVKSFLVYGQVFSGYGQSLIEYNHKTTSAGIGIALNDWMT